MEILIQPDAAHGSKLAALVVARLLKSMPKCVLGLATGNSPRGLYADLIRLHREHGLDFSNVTTFNLDEYVGLSPDHPCSYHHFMRTIFFNHINIAHENTHLPDGMAADLREECLNYEEKIISSGGIDLQILGLGGNGHIGFNEPTGSLASRTWVKILSQATLRDNAANFASPEEMPHHCITMGIGTIMKSRHNLLLAFGEKKAAALAAMIEGPVSAMCPASALQFHPRVTVIADEAAASKLTLKDHYRWIEKNKLPWQDYQNA